MNSRKKKKSKGFHCFACKRDRPISVLARKGTRPNGSKWALCRECSDTYRKEREMDREAYHAARDDIRTGERGYTEMGWNGVPSEKALRRRSR